MDRIIKAVQLEDPAELSFRIYAEKQGILYAFIIEPLNDCINIAVFLLEQECRFKLIDLL